MTRGPMLPTGLPPALPNSGSRMSLCPPPPAVANTKLARLKTLKAAASNFRLNRSVNLKFFDRVRSDAQKPGPTKVLRPRLPTQPKHGAVRTGRLVAVLAAQPFAQV